MLTKNFDLSEFITSPTAERYGIDNTPNEFIIRNLKLLCMGCLQPLRDAVGVAIVITSGYRCIKLNKLVGGDDHSQHMVGQAADIIVPANRLKDVFNYIKDNLLYDQVIYEHGVNGDWIHVSYEHGANRRQALISNIVNGKREYIPA